MLKLKVKCKVMTMLVAVSVLALHRSSSAQMGTTLVLPIMPLPAHVERQAGEFPIDSRLKIAFEGYTEPRLNRAGERMLAVLERETGLALATDGASGANESGAKATKFVIRTGGASEAVQQLGEDESYRLEITPSAVTLSAPNPLGILRGLQTFLQLVVRAPKGAYAPAVVIEDRPRFPWRGLMIDAGRHFQPVEVIKRNLDGMEAVKLNVFHWHLSENQGFRVESLKYPLLQEKGSDGLYYTQAQVREVIEYARDRGIRVVPEFDMPGHTTAWFVGYPELASAPGPYTIERHWGVFDPAMDPSRESTYRFVDGLIGEMAALFPDAYFHIGGDECNGKQWDGNAAIKAFMHTNGLADDAALQAYFTKRVQKIVAAHGKIMEGWDEVLQPDTPTDVVIQSWRGPDSLADAARRGYSGLLSAGYYIDLNFSAADHYSPDPLGGKAATLPAEQQKHILGGEATMWSEFTSPENIDSRIWPRTAAIAERLWSPQSVTDVGSMYERLALVSARLEFYGLQHRASYPAMLSRLAGGRDTAALKVLGDVMEPPKGYVRGTLAEYTSATPLDRLVDAIPPESDTARRFRLLAGRVAAGTATREEWEQAHKWLVLWHDNDAQLQPLLAKSALTQELIPVSTNLSQVAAVGLQALELLRQHKSPVVGWKAEQLAFLKKSEMPQAVLLNMAAPGVEVLVRASPSS
ncbi:MAG TPA: family 20 glycosylhydrolase [Acidisarcina sp.]